MGDKTKKLFKAVKKTLTKAGLRFGTDVENMYFVIGYTLDDKQYSDLKGVNVKVRVYGESVLITSFAEYEIDITDVEKYTKMLIYVNKINSRLNMGNMELSLEEDDNGDDVKGYFLYRVMVPCYKRTLPDNDTIMSLINWGSDQVLKYWNGVFEIIKDSSNPNVIFNKYNTD